MGFPTSKPQTGSSYVVVLVLISVLSALALTFVTRTGMRISAGAARSEQAQAAYLAETAVHHATWRLLYEPGFPADETVYEMHGLGAGRYGYKVRAPTPTTIATIASVGIVGEAVVRQSWAQYVLSRIMTVYGESTGMVPPYRRLVGATWGAPGATIDTGTPELTFAELAGSPVADEMILATMNSDDVVRVAVWDGVAWGTPLAFATGNQAFKCFDVAYESVTGEALVVAWNGAKGQLRYMSSSGGLWAAPAELPTGEDATITLVQMASHPKSDEILVVVDHDNHAVVLLRWNGTALAFLARLETAATHNDTFVADVAYEQESGHGLVVWGRDGQAQGAYSIWNGLAVSSPALLPSFAKHTQLIRLAVEPGSDRVALAAVADDKDLHAAIWDGAVWADWAELETNVEQPASKDWLNFDVGWEEELIVCWAQNGSSLLRYVRCPPDSTLASRPVETGPDFGGAVFAATLLPVDGTRNLVLLGGTSAAELRYSLWVGNRFAADPAQTLSSSLSATVRFPFGIARAAG